MKNLTGTSIKPTQAVLLMALAGMLSLCSACTKLSEAEYAFKRQYEKDHPGDKIVKVVLRPLEGQGKYKGRCTVKFKRHDFMKEYEEYEQVVWVTYAHGDCYYNARTPSVVDNTGCP